MSRIQIIITVPIFTVLIAFACKQDKTEIITNKVSHISAIDSLSNIYDNDTNVVHWELWNDTLHIYTKEDSARDELERIKYIMNLEHEFDSLFEYELRNEN